MTTNSTLQPNNANNSTHQSLISSVAVNPDLPTRRVGRFYLTKKLGTGTSGSVYLGHDPVIDREVAIKILDNQANPSGKKQREQQFINEARAAGRLSHSNIVTIYDASSEGNTTYIAMEFLRGKDLGELIASGTHFDVIETVSIIRKIALALAYAHSNGVIHRDIKPANIFILEDKQPKIVDFGIARAPNRMADSDGSAPATLFNNNILGTPNYMSPEQAMGLPVNSLTDVYSLGAVMYEMLTGQKPFQGRDMDKLLQKIVRKMPTPPSEVNSRISKSLSNIVLTAMQKNPAMRFKDAEEMARALEKYIARDQRLKQKRQQTTIGDLRGRLTVGKGENIFSSWVSWVGLAVALSLVIYSLIRK
jgi:eukaryotic-like serine/threonine-protein kinase